MREKRRFIRFDIALKVNYTVQKDPKTEKTGMTKDISAGGMQFLTEEKIDAGNKLDLKMFIPEALNPAHMNGIALWSKETTTSKGPSYCTGVEFGKIEEDNKTTFLRFLCDMLYKRLEK
ncbi:MAG: PilZ domain-containing protein [Candidatus Omnitrophica bacterium]|nr:PilZ domain-containing protein [Candidatus Omnitrophota bacterium]